MSVILSIVDTTVVNRLDDEPHGDEESPEPFFLANHTPSDLAVAEVFDRAEAIRDTREQLSLERLIATCGFGRIHRVQAATKPHQMVGRNVAVIKDVDPGISSPAAAEEAPRPDDDSNDISLSSRESVPQTFSPPIACRISIAPIVSSNAAVGSGDRGGPEKEVSHLKTKRGKHHHSSELDSSHKAPPPGDVAATGAAQPVCRKYQPLQHVTHFVVQLQPVLGDAAGKYGSMESLSSDSLSVQANLLGMTKTEFQAQRGALSPGVGVSHLDTDVDAGVEGSPSISSEREAVSAIG